MATTGRFYSATRRIQQLIGKMPDGTAIWGGPYTITQVVTTVVVALALFFGLSVLGIGTAARVVYAVLIGATIGWALGKIPTPRRPVVSTVDALASMLLHTTAGRVAGREMHTHPVVRAGMKRARQTRQEDQAAAKRTRKQAQATGGDKTTSTGAAVSGGTARVLTAAGDSQEGSQR